MADSQFLLRNETHQMIGSAMEVLNEISLSINFKHPKFEFKRIVR
jgi:hypothetical protein